MSICKFEIIDMMSATPMRVMMIPEMRFIHSMCRGRKYFLTTFIMEAMMSHQPAHPAKMPKIIKAFEKALPSVS